MKPPVLKERKVLVVGLARTGLAAASFLLDQGARVILTDNRTRDRLGPAVEDLAERGAALDLGGHAESSFTEADLIVVSPGVPPTLPELEAARKKGVSITGELELASTFLQEPLIAVTGANGKTTTTSLIGEMLRADGRRVFVGGNIGNPLIGYVHEGEAADVVVAEVSSFQLETVDFFRPRTGVLLNVTPDHLDRHHTLEEYLVVKARLFARQEEDDFAVINSDDALTASLEVRSGRLEFSRRKQVEHGAFVQDGVIYVVESGRIAAEAPAEKMNLVGVHNQENIMAATLAASTLGVDPGLALQTAASFVGLPHRLELVGEFGGVRYFNDSKGTNVGAVLGSLQSFDPPVILIAGGRDKAGDFGPLKEPVRRLVKLLILIGEAAPAMEKVLGSETQTVTAPDMAAAVDLARKNAAPGDVVLLSPACASFDMFDDYGHRGRVFSELVLQGAQK